MCTRTMLCIHIFQHGSNTQFRVLFDESRAPPVMCFAFLLFPTDNMALALHALPTASVTPLAIALQRGWQSLWALPRDILELFPPFLLAVPKSKVSHSRKSMRSANKGLKEKFSEFCSEHEAWPLC